MITCSFLAPDTAAQAAVLRDDLRAIDADATLWLLDLCDGAIDLPGVTLVRPEELFDAVGLRDIAAVRRTTWERVDSMLPTLLTRALESDQAVVFLAPATLLRAPLSRLFEEHASDVVLARRLPATVPDDDLQPTAADVMRRGAVSDELIALRRNSKPFLDWWAARVRPVELARRSHDLLDHPSLYFDQGTRHHRWLDAASASDLARVEFADGWARSQWNIGLDDESSKDANCVILDHLDVDAPWRPDPQFDLRPRFRLSRHEELRVDVMAWVDRVRDARASLPELVEWRAVRADGAAIQPRMRRVHERALAYDFEIVGDPFDAAALEDYDRWLTEPEPNTRISRYLHDIWRSRADLWAPFPDGPNADADAFEEWIRAGGHAEESIPAQLVPAPPASRPSIVPAARAPRPGVLISGYLNSVMGLGEAARLVAGAVAMSGIESATVSYSRTVAEQGEEYDTVVEGDLNLDTHIACVNVDTFVGFARELGPAAFEGRRTIGLWFWETSRLPDAMLGAFDYVDEIWVACEFVRDVLRQYTDKPISIYPQPVPVPERGEQSRAQLGLPEAFTFLFAFDFNSVIERKNPMALVEAFRRAFAPGEGPVLVLKTINGFRRVADCERLALAVADRPDIRIVDEFFPAWKRDAWTAEADCYVSLHRSEGFGLTMAEAMACGKPVIASRYSGNLAFMDDDNSLLVDCTETTVPAGCDPYPEGATWGDPDIEQAAEHMRSVYEDAALRDRLGAAARSTILQRHGRDAMAAWVRDQLEAGRSDASTSRRRSPLRRLARR